MAKKKNQAAKAAPKKASAPAPKVPVNEPVNEQKEESLDKIVTIIKGSDASVSSDAIITILGGMINSTGKDSPVVKQFVENLEKEGVKDDNDKISRVIIYTCNSFILSLWKAFGNDFKRIYKEMLERQQAELDAKRKNLD